MNRSYFAYGSNLCFPRLRHRVPGVERIGPGRLRGYQLRWHKRGSDGSGKCSILAGREDVEVHGALFHVPPEERAALDRVEGLGVGYREARVRVRLRDRIVEAWTYIAAETHVDESLLPFRWYRDLVIAGARSLALPRAYVDRIRRVAVLDDPDERRVARNRRFLDPE